MPSLANAKTGGIGKRGRATPTAAVAFAPVAVPGDGVPARVALDGDALTTDDAFHFLLRRAPTISA